MGGNVTINGVSARPVAINLNTHELINEIVDGIAASFAEFHKAYLWEPVQEGEMVMLSGSTRVVYQVGSNLIYPHKTTMGDIDLMVPIHKRAMVWEWLSAIDRINERFHLVGWKETDQFILLLNDTVQGTTIQVDLEPVEFDVEGPKEWERFARSSSFEDIKMGIKGVFHKYLIRACTNKDATINKVRTARALVEEKAGRYSFSVTKGIRERYTTNDQGEKVRVNPKTATFYRDIDMLARILGVPAHRIFCFYHLANTTSLAYNETQKKNVLESFVKILWGKGAQQIYADPVRDHDAKTIAYRQLAEYYRVGDVEGLSDIKMDYYGKSGKAEV